MVAVAGAAIVAAAALQIVADPVVLVAGNVHAAAAVARIVADLCAGRVHVVVVVVAVAAQIVFD